MDHEEKQATKQLPTGTLLRVVYSMIVEWQEQELVLCQSCLERWGVQRGVSLSASNFPAAAGGRHLFQMKGNRTLAFAGYTKKGGKNYE